MKLRKISLVLIPLAAVIMGLAVWGPEALARYRDKSIFNQINEQKVQKGMEGYRYFLSGNEKLYILAKCLNNQILPESEQSAMTRMNSANLDYQELTGSYAFVANRKDLSGQQLSEEAGVELCNQGIEELKALGILPQGVRGLEASSYSAVQYSAIDVPEPRNNVLVWKISLNTATKNANKENSLLDAYVDADTGKIYEFYVRTQITSWREVNAGDMIRSWAGYMGLEEPVRYEDANPLTETTPYFEKYIFEGMGEDKTIVTIGFYEGINELYLKISQ